MSDKIESLQEYIAKQEQEIAELKEFKAGLLRCVKSQREEIKKLQTDNDNAALRVASLGGEAVRQVKMFNEQVDEIAELKSKLASAKVDLIKTIISDINIGYAHCELNCDDILDYLNGEEAKLREGE